MWHSLVVGCFVTMFTQRLRRLLKVGGSSQHDLAWGLQPILLWVQILGISSPRLHSTSRIQHWSVLLLGVVLMVWMVCSSTGKILDYIHTEICDWKQKGSRTWMWTDALQEVQLHIASILISVSLFVVTLSQRTSMWNCIIEAERSIRFTDDFHRSVRKISIAASILFVLVKRFQTGVDSAFPNWSFKYSGNCKRYLSIVINWFRKTITDF